MKGKVIPFTIMGMLFALALLGGSVMVWQAGVASPEPTPAQRQLVELAELGSESGGGRAARIRRRGRAVPAERAVKGLGGIMG